VPALGENVSVPLIIFSREDDNLAAINTLLRQAGIPVHCRRVDQPNQLEEALREQRPDMLIVFSDERGIDIPTLAAQLSKLAPNPPLLIVRENITEQVIADAMGCGARDVVSLTHKNRFQAVFGRELHTHRVKVALGGVVTSAKQYRHELRTLMEGTAEAIADIQEGIVVAANPPWLELFGYASLEDIVDVPFMDVCSSADHPVLKGALVACMKGKWDGTMLTVKGISADGEEFPIEISLELVAIDGEPAVRIVVPTEHSIETSTTELLEQAVFKDPTTGFYRRHFFVDKLDAHLKTKLAGGVRTLAYIRPDNFARVHDDIGMLATEKLLTKLAAKLKDFMTPADLYGRFGGTMFVALLERGTMKDVEAWAEQLRKTISDSVFEVDKQSTSITCTIGICEIETGDVMTEELLKLVEGTCRTGRDAGGNRVQLCANTTATLVTLQSDEMWLPRIRKALMENKLRLVHQAVSGLTEEIDNAFDTRVQMLDENDNVVLASEFLPAAERAGMTKNVDRWVIGASFSFCKAKQPNLVFIRLSDSSVTDISLFDWVRARLKSTGVDPTKICFQISETVAAHFLRETKHIAVKLRELGFRVAIDHMGTGRDSTRLLSHIPMDFMKIDGSLMQGLHRNPQAQSEVGDLTRAAQQLNIKSIAERVEDANTMAILWQLGIAYIQGNYIQMHGVVLEDTQSNPSITAG
jgi:diguanylate cyclase (GGDEF)-like protein/PAS domain S-box-containing protein